MKKIILLLCLFAISITSCRKLSVYPEDLDPATGNNQSKLLVGSWKVTAAKVKEVYADGRVDEYDNLPAYVQCDRDDLAIYRADNVFVYDYGSDICEPSEASPMMGTWSISKDNKFLTVIFPPNDFIEDFTTEIVSLNTTTLVTSITLAINEVVYTNTVTLTKVK